MHDHFQTRHRSLNHVLGTPTGHHGRAVVPSESPFELRQRVNDNPSDATEARPAKRRKCDITPPTKKGYAQNLFGATLTLSAVPASSAPPRPTTGPAPQAQSELSQSREEPMPDGTPLRQDDRNVAAGNSFHGILSRETAVAPASRTVLKPAQSAVFGSRGPPGPPSKTLTRRSMEKPISHSRESTRRLPDAGNDFAASVDHDAPPSSAGGPVIASARPKAGTNLQTPQPTTVAKPAQKEANAQAAVISRSGTSNSQPIVLDEDDGRSLRGVDQVSKRGQQAASKGDPPKPAKQKSTKPQRKPPTANRPLVTESRPPVACPQEGEDTAQEERTELRLKPRQKRGLLLLSEKKTRPKQLKHQGAPASHLDPIDDFTKQPQPAAADKPSLALALASETIGPYGPPRADDSSAFLPAEPGSPTACTGFPSLLSNGSQVARSAPGLESEAADSTPHQATTAPSHDETRSLEQPESPKPAGNKMGSARDGIVDSSHSSRGSSVGSRRRGAARIHRESAEMSDLDAEEISAGVGVPEPILPRASRQTRKTRRLDDQGSNRPKKKERMEEPEEDDSDEFPRAPVRPHLARLSRSVRSREVIGFMPSSSPVAEIVDPVQPVPAAMDEAVEANCVASPTNKGLAASEGSQVSTREPQMASPPINPSRAAPPALQRHNSLPDSRAGESRSSHSRDIQAAAPRVPLPHEPPPRRSLVRHTSAVLPRGSGLDNTAAARSIPGPERSAAPEKEIGPTTTATRSPSPNRKKTLAADSITLPPPLHNRSSNFSEQPDHPMNDTVDIGIVTGVTRGTNNQPADVPAPEPARPRIANPATRGRKAALKSDAAGQVPQPILPVEPAPPVRVGMRSGAMPRPDPAVNERPKRTMRFPGFTSVKECGPWSREAHDLLGSERPV